VPGTMGAAPRFVIIRSWTWTWTCCVGARSVAFLFYFPSGGEFNFVFLLPAYFSEWVCAAADTHGRRSSNHLFFDAVGKPSTHEDRDSGDRERRGV